MAQLPSRFGPYEVIALLGAGGMGEVYRARDPRLNRTVAIKVLARAGADPSRQQRFLDEAQAASALNHPNIISVYDVGTHDGAPFIVSELVEGTSVRDLLARAPLTVREVLDLGVQMADGLAAAHQAGIVHRDFKPENVMVTSDGRVKILDFGLALVGTRDGMPAADMDVTLTATGMIVGTVPYMSPEQARGATVDFRTDQFSLGLTLYEMSTGRRAFSAETSAQILAAILDDEPEPIAKLNARVPAPVRWVIERCLSKDARQRYDATTDLTRDLRTLRDRLTEFTSSADVAPPPKRRRWLAPAVAALAALAAIGVLAVLGNSRADAGLERYQFTPFATDAGYQASPAWSPDGKTLAFVADVDGILQIFTRALASSLRAQVTRSRFDCRDPFWSPDGTRVYFISRARDRDGLWSISASGGEPEIVMENVSRAELSPDGKTLAFFRDIVAAENATGMTLWLASPPESPPVAYTRPPFGARTGYSQATLHFSPDGSKLGVWAVASLSAETPTEPSEFWVLPLGTGAPRHVPSPVPDLHGMTPAFSWLPDNRRVLSAVPRPQPGLHMWLMDTERGDARLLVSTAGLENDPAVSPDGTRLALTLQQADFDLYQLSLDHPSPSVVLATSRNEMDPTWSPSLTAMAFTTDRNGREEIWLRSQKGDFERPLVTPDDFAASRTDFLSAPEVSPDGRRVAYNRIGADGNRVWISPLAGGPPVQLAQGPQAQDWPSWSPDGVWIACAQVTVGKGTWALAKVRVGARTPPEVIASDILPLSPVHWAPSGNWIAYNGLRGLSIASPDGQSTRVLHEDAWMAFTWSADSQKVFGIRQSDDLTHLTFTSVDVASGTEHVLSPDIKAAPVARQPVRGLTRTSPTTFVTSIVGVRSDVWLLDGFRSSPTFWERATSAIAFRRR